MGCDRRVAAWHETRRRVAASWKPGDRDNVGAWWITVWLLFLGELILVRPVPAQQPADGSRVLALRVDVGLANEVMSGVSAWLIHEAGLAPGSPALAAAIPPTDAKGLITIPLAAGGPSHLVLETLPEVNEAVEVQTLLIPSVVPVGLVRNQHGKAIAATARSLSSFSDFDRAIEELDILGESIKNSGNSAELAPLSKRVAWTKGELRRLKEAGVVIPRVAAVPPPGKREKTTVSLVPVVLPWGAAAPPKEIQDPKVEKAFAAIAERFHPSRSGKRPDAGPAPPKNADPAIDAKVVGPPENYEVESCYVFDALGRPVPAPDWTPTEQRDEIQLRLFPGAFYEVLLIPRVSRLGWRTEFVPDPALISICPSNVRPPTNKPPAPYDGKLLVRCRLPYESTEGERRVRIRRMQRLVGDGMKLVEGVERERLQRLHAHLNMLMEKVDKGPPPDPRAEPRPIACLVHLVKAAPDQEWQGFLNTVRACPDTHFWAVCDTTNPAQFAGYFPKLPNLHVLGHINFAAQTTLDEQSSWALEARKFGAVGFLIDNYDRDKMENLGPVLRRLEVKMIIARSASGIAEEEDIQSRWIDGVMSSAVSETSYDSQSVLARRQLLHPADPAALSPRVRLGMLDRSLMNVEDLESSFKKAIESRCELISFSPVGVLAPNGLPVAADQVQIPPAAFWQKYLALLQQHNRKCNQHWANMAAAGIVAP